MPAARVQVIFSVATTGDVVAATEFTINTTTSEAITALGSMGRVWLGAVPYHT